MGQLQEKLKEIFNNSAEAFVFCDASGNGMLSETELQRVLKKFEAPEGWTTELMWAMDTDVRDGVVDAREFVKYLAYASCPSLTMLRCF
eukprot:3232963-Rhodomonas_salina.3